MSSALSTRLTTVEELCVTFYMNDSRSLGFSSGKVSFAGSGIPSVKAFRTAGKNSSFFFARTFL